MLHGNDREARFGFFQDLQHLWLRKKPETVIASPKGVAISSSPEIAPSLRSSQ